MYPVPLISRHITLAHTSLSTPTRELIQGLEFEMNLCEENNLRMKLISDSIKEMYKTKLDRASHDYTSKTVMFTNDKT